ncbi:MAG: InlB B-repeat-containing protein [Coprobacillaceae bacterium]
MKKNTKTLNFITLFLLITILFWSVSSVFTIHANVETIPDIDTAIEEPNEEKEAVEKEGQLDEKEVEDEVKIEQDVNNVEEPQVNNAQVDIVESQDEVENLQELRDALANPTLTDIYLKTNVVIEVNGSPITLPNDRSINIHGNNATLTLGSGFTGRHFQSLTSNIKQEVSIENINFIGHNNLTKSYVEMFEEEVDNVNSTFIVGGGIHFIGEENISNYSTLNITGSTFKGCNAGKQDNGGAIRAEYVNVNIDNTLFEDNSVFIYNTSSTLAPGGGGVYLNKCNGVIENSTFNNNIAAAGGALLLNNSIDNTAYTVLLNNVKYNGNVARADGGAVATGGTWANNVQVDSCEFINNKASSNGGAFSHARGLRQNKHQFTNCLFKGNYAYYQGGAINVDALGDRRNRATSLEIVGCDFEENETNIIKHEPGSGYGGKGGAIWTDALENTIENSTFKNNKAFIGGAIYYDYLQSDNNYDNKLTISNAEFMANESTIDGGVIYLYESYARNKVVVLTNTIFQENVAGGDGGGIGFGYNWGGDGAYADIEIDANTIFNKNKASRATLLEAEAQQIIHDTNIKIEPREFSINYTEIFPNIAKIDKNYVYNNYDIINYFGPEIENKTVVFDLQNGNMNGQNSIANQIVFSNTKIENPGTPQKTDMIFDGWIPYYLDGTAVFSSLDRRWDFETDTFPETIDTHIILRAMWKGQEYTVQFDVQGGTPTISPQIFKSPDLVVNKIHIPNVPTKKGYSFGGWYTLPKGEGEKYDIGYTVNQDQTVYAYWIEDVYSKIEPKDSDNKKVKTGDSMDTRILICSCLLSLVVIIKVKLRKMESYYMK